jgi:NAD(P) transhydrogenase
MKRYDIVVIGSGPGGQKAAIQAAKLGKTVAVVERQPYVGGAGLHTGTLPSKTLRERALFLAGFKERAVLGFHLTVGKDLTLGDLMSRKSEVIKRQMEVIIGQFDRNNVEIVYGNATFSDPHRLLVEGPDGDSELRGDVIVIAAGSSPSRPAAVPFDGDHIYDSDTILGLDRMPASLAIVGGGVIGCEYSCIFAALGVKVTLIEKKERLLPFADGEAVTSLMYWMRHSGVTLRLAEAVAGIEVQARGRVAIALESGKSVVTEKLLYTMGRVGNSEGLNLAAAGIEVGERGVIRVNEAFQTAAPHIYAVGDVIGYPSLASTSMEQGRRAVCHAFQKEGVTCDFVGALPFCVYTIPEISMVGDTEEALTARRVAYESGCAYFNEVARGQIVGDTRGMLKLLFERSDRRLLGVHIVGDRASELIHIGQAVLNFGGAIDYFKDAVFNYPTLSEAYKEAALNGINKL